MRLEVQRKQKKLTQAQLGRLIGVSQQQVAKYEAGLSVPTPKVLNRIIDVLEVTLPQAWRMFYDENTPDDIAGGDGMDNRRERHGNQ